MSGYPESGNVTITVSGNNVYLQRIAGAGKYVFPAQGLVYTPATCSSTTPGRPARGPRLPTPGPTRIYEGDTLTITGTRLRQLTRMRPGALRLDPLHRHLVLDRHQDPGWAPSVPAEGQVHASRSSRGKSCARATAHLQVYAAAASAPARGCRSPTAAASPSRR